MVSNNVIEVKVIISVKLTKLILAEVCVDYVKLIWQRIRPSSQLSGTIRLLNLISGNNYLSYDMLLEYIFTFSRT